MYFDLASSLRRYFSLACIIGIIRNDTVVGDPLYTVPINSLDQDQNLCFEVHGASNASFNLISDSCVSVNAHYSPALGGQLNIISAIAVRAEDENGACHSIHVDLEGCTVSTGTGTSGELTALGSRADVRVGRVSARSIGTDRVRVSVPNCDSVNLVLWVVCERQPLDMIRFQIARGVNLAPTSHGLLGTVSSSCILFLRTLYK